MNLKARQNFLSIVAVAAALASSASSQAASPFDGNPLFQNPLWWFGTPNPNPPPPLITTYEFVPLADLPGFTQQPYYGWLEGFDFETTVLDQAFADPRERATRQNLLTAILAQGITLDKTETDLLLNGREWEMLSVVGYVVDTVLDSSNDQKAINKAVESILRAIQFAPDSIRSKLVSTVVSANPEAARMVLNSGANFPDEFAAEVTAVVVAVAGPDGVTDQTQSPVVADPTSEQETASTETLPEPTETTASPS